MKRLLEILLFTIIIASVLGGTIWLSLKHINSGDQELPKALIGAFSGAFFAFLFVRLGDALSKLYDRQNKNYDGLVRIQHQLNDYLNLTSDNIFIVETFIKIFTDKAIKEEDPRVFFNKLHEYLINRELLFAFTNIDFANDIYQLYTEAQKLNTSMSNVDDSYDQMRCAYIDKKIDLTTYIKNVALTRTRYEEIKRFLTQFQKDIIRSLAASRVLSQSKPPLARLILWLSKSNYSKTFQNNLDAEITKLESEIKTISEASKKKIETISKQ